MENPVLGKGVLKRTSPSCNSCYIGTQRMGIKFGSNLWCYIRGTLCNSVSDLQTYNIEEKTERFIFWWIYVFVTKAKIPVYASVLLAGNFSNILLTLCNVVFVI